MKNPLALSKCRRKFFAVAQCVTLAGLVLITACSRVTPNAGDNSSPKGAARIPQRIISLSPNVTEILADVGTFDRVVAVSQYCDFPPEVQELPRVGGWQNTNMEQVNVLQPDLVIMTESQAPFVESRLQALGLPALVVRSQSLEHVFAAIREIGRAVGNDTQAQSLIEQTQASLDKIRSRTMRLSHPKVLCVVDRIPGTLRDLYTATKGSFLEELIEIAGGQSIAPADGAGYGKITKEAVLTLNPDIIIDMVQGAKGRLAENPLAVWQELSEIRAVRHRRIYPITETSVLHPSQFVAKTARRFAKTIHPEVFADVRE
ncbi:MAG: ABC transporter substrate-binding protein [Acidobacteria bacterium]|nr:ABC transporter substrate-binding protein [Acidobacteriota bacterium]